MRAAFGGMFVGLGLAWMAAAGCSSETGAADTAADSAVTETTTDATTTPETATATETSPNEVTEVGEVDGDTAIVLPTDRPKGARTPLTARCDAAEEARCLLPWPSNVFTIADATTATGLRVHLATDVLPDEGLELLNQADGFSRLTPIVALIPLGTDAAQVAIRVYDCEPGALYGREVAVRVTVYPGRDDQDPAALVATALEPLAPSSEHLVIVTGVAPNHAADLALGNVPPTTDDEAALVAYHAPHRALLAPHSDIDPRSIGRLWDFTTRSAEDPLTRLKGQAAAAKAGVDDGTVKVTIDAVTVPDANATGPALFVKGHLSDIPDPAATPGALEGTSYSVPFRVVVPRGTDDYRVVLYGHGTGGNIDDTAFDDLITDAGAAKVNIEVDGWTDATVGGAISGLLVPLSGTRDLTARMRRAQAGIAAIQRALVGPLGDALGAEAITGQANPTAHRRPRKVIDAAGKAQLELPIWAGGSLGGVTGMVYGHLEPTIIGGILNVPGAGFTHWLSASSLFELVGIALSDRYPAIVDLEIATAMTQPLWDEVDGAAWAGSRSTAPIFLVQMSVGDPVMPNLASALVARSLHATIVGGTPYPISDLETATIVNGASALTEFVAPGDSALQIHGFAARDTDAGRAAQAQIRAFIESLWSGTPSITLPDACLALDPPGTCDFGP